MKTDRLTGPPKENNYKWQIIVENAYKTSAFHHFRPKSNYSSVILGNKNYAVKNICLVISARYLKHPNFLQGLLTIIIFSVQFLMLHKQVQVKQGIFSIGCHKSKRQIDMLAARLISIQNFLKIKSPICHLFFFSDLNVSKNTLVLTNKTLANANAIIKM